jgi:hypothetical protein
VIGRAACENIIMDRGYQYIENQFAGGAKAVLVVTHSMTGAGIPLPWAGLTGSMGNGSDRGTSCSATATFARRL